MNKFISTVVIVGSILASTSAFAGDQDIPLGTYGLLGFGRSPLIDAYGTKTSYLGIAFGAGYNFNPYIGVEGSINSLGEPSTEAMSLSLVAVGHIPLIKGYGIYLKSGEGYNIVTIPGINAGSAGTLTGLGLVSGAGIEITSHTEIYRFGIDHYDLAAGGFPMSTNFLNFTMVVAE